jgi:hypothetical protein
MHVKDQKYVEQFSSEKAKKAVVGRILLKWILKKEALDCSQLYQKMDRWRNLVYMTRMIPDDGGSTHL